MGGVRRVQRRCVGCAVRGARCASQGRAVRGAHCIYIFFVFKQFGRLLSCERLSSNVGSGMLLAGMVITLHGGAWYV